MTFQIARRGREYLKAVQTLLHAAQTITDRAIADRLKALADDYERRAEKVSHVDAAKEFARSGAQKASGLFSAWMRAASSSQLCRSRRCWRPRRGFFDRHPRLRNGVQEPEFR